MPWEKGRNSRCKQQNFKRICAFAWRSSCYAIVFCGSREFLVYNECACAPNIYLIRRVIQRNQAWYYSVKLVFSISVVVQLLCLLTLKGCRLSRRRVRTSLSLVLFHMCVCVWRKREIFCYRKSYSQILLLRPSLVLPKGGLLAGGLNIECRTKLQIRCFFQQKYLYFPHLSTKKYVVVLIRCASPRRL